jgi:hypothetical protein
MFWQKLQSPLWREVRAARHAPSVVAVTGSTLGPFAPNPVPERRTGTVGRVAPVPIPLLPEILSPLVWKAVGFLILPRPAQLPHPSRAAQANPESLLHLRPFPCSRRPRVAMGRGKFKGKPTGRRNFSTPEEIGNDAPFLSFRCSVLVELEAVSAAACPWPDGHCLIWCYGRMVFSGFCVLQWNWGSSKSIISLRRDTDACLSRGEARS